MDLGLQGRVIAVSGSTRGIGRACAESLLSEGSRVAICGRSAKGVEAATEALSHLGTVTGVVADVSTKQGCTTFIDSTRRILGPIDGLLVNTGGPPQGELDDHSDETWQAACELLLLSAVRLIQGVTPEMTRRQFGRIVIITSVSVKDPLPSMVLSNSIRAAVTGLMRSEARRLGQSGITVNCVAPGYTKTRRVEELAEEMAKNQATTPEKMLKRWESQIPANRLADPSEVAAAVSFLLSEKASYINGVTLTVDGGFSRSFL